MVPKTRGVADRAYKEFCSSIGSPSQIPEGIPGIPFFQVSNFRLPYPGVPIFSGHRSALLKASALLSEFSWITSRVAVCWLFYGITTDGLRGTRVWQKLGTRVVGLI